MGKWDEFADGLNSFGRAVELLALGGVAAEWLGNNFEEFSSEAERHEQPLDKWLLHLLQHAHDAHKTDHDKSVFNSPDWSKDDDDYEIDDDWTVPTRMCSNTNPHGAHQWPKMTSKEPDYHCKGVFPPEDVGGPGV